MRHSPHSGSHVNSQPTHAAWIETAKSSSWKSWSCTPVAHSGSSRSKAALSATEATVPTSVHGASSPLGRTEKVSAGWTAAPVPAKVPRKCEHRPRSQGQSMLTELYRRSAMSSERRRPATPS